MDDTSTIKCLSPDKGKKKCYFNHFNITFNHFYSELDYREK